MKDHVEDLNSLKAMLASVETQANIAAQHEGNAGQFPKEMKSLQLEYRLFQQKKVKIEMYFGDKKMNFVGMLNNQPVVSAEDFSVGSSLRKYERLVTDLGHRRYIRKAGILSKLKVY